MKKDFSKVIYFIARQAIIYKKAWFETVLSGIDIHSILF